ncbi:MAG: hypothetical protein CMH56_03505 [Myxococcales bacterium]|nr:hypothetical protein [Myxococcales bacterium]|tara:strand:+ start:672 stop:1544 length:873 start_codon:yes stop_codon:yes gene_type:complete
MLNKLVQSLTKTQKTAPWALALGAGLVFSVPAGAETKTAKEASTADVVQNVGHNQVNWTSKVVVATGSGAANLKDGNVAVARLGAERAAKMDALRNILETIKGIQIDGKRNAGDLMSNGTIQSKVTGIAQGFQVVDTKYYSDGSVDVKVKMPLDDKLAGAFIQVPDKKKKKLPTKGASNFTGLVVNAQKLEVTPSMAPRIVDENGAEVYGVTYVSEKALQQGGIVTYVKDLGSAKKDTRIGNKPLVVRALSTSKGAATDLVIANADADKLRDKSQNLSFLVDGKVLVVLD